MLEKTYDCFSRSFPNPKTAWDRFLEFVLVDHDFGHTKELHPKLDWMFEDARLRESIRKTYKRSLLATETYDHLGDLYVNRLVKTGVVKCARSLPSHDVVAGMAAMLASQCEKAPSILDPTAGTGRLLLAVRQIAPESALFGVEKNLDLARIAMTNLAIHAIPGFVLHADPEKHEIDLSNKPGKANWDYANSWHSHMERLHPTTSPKTKELIYVPSVQHYTPK